MMPSKEPLMPTDDDLLLFAKSVAALLDAHTRALQRIPDMTTPAGRTAVQQDNLYTFRQLVVDAEHFGIVENTHLSQSVSTAQRQWSFGASIAQEAQESSP
jgi:hypothetical protein